MVATQKYNETSKDIDFQLGLLHMVHLLVMVDGKIDQREKVAITRIKIEENIPDQVISDFEESILTESERQIYVNGIDMINRCTEEERLCAFVHLYQLAEADDDIDLKEVRFLFYSLKATKISFEDVELSTRMSKAAGMKWR